MKYTLEIDPYIRQCTKPTLALLLPLNIPPTPKNIPPPPPSNTIMRRQQPPFLHLIQHLQARNPLLLLFTHPPLPYKVDISSRLPPLEPLLS